MAQLIGCRPSKQFHSPSGHLPRLRVRFLVRVHAGGSPLMSLSNRCFPPSLSPSLPLSLKVNKSKKWLQFDREQEWHKLRYTCKLQGNFSPLVGRMRSWDKNRSSFIGINVLMCISIFHVSCLQSGPSLCPKVEVTQDRCDVCQSPQWVRGPWKQSSLVILELPFPGFDICFVLGFTF